MLDTAIESLMDPVDHVVWLAAQSLLPHGLLLTAIALVHEPVAIAVAALVGFR